MTGRRQPDSYRKRALYNQPRCGICGMPMLCGQKLVHLSCQITEPAKESQ